MIGSTRNLQVHIAPEPTDMRKSYNGLFAIARDSIGLDPLSGHLFLFVAKNRKRAKVLHWDGTGLCIYMKRLEQGRFIAPWERLRAENDELVMTQNELGLFLEGSQEVRRVLSPRPFCVNS